MMMMVQDKNIENLKNGNVSYFSLSKNEIDSLKKILKEQIQKDKNEIKIIKEQINAEKAKFMKKI